MDFKHNIGKSTLTVSLVAAAGIIAQEAAGDVRMIDTCADEAERGLTIKYTEAEVLKHISNFNDDPSVHGILVQLPLLSVSF